MSAAPWTEAVRPATAGRETRYVAGACAAVLAVAAVAIQWRGTVAAAQELAEYQISAYTGLNAVEQGIYNDLLAASLDIDLYHADTMRWPTVLQLQGQYIAPFVKDLSWQQRGALEWEIDIPDIEQQHTVSYFALSSQPDASGSFVLWMTHKHNMSGPMAEAFQKQRGVKTVSGQDVMATPGPGNMPGGIPMPGGIGGDLGIGGLPAPQPTLPPAGAAGKTPQDLPMFKPQVRIWYHPGGDAEAPGVYLDEHLIKAGWREVIARTGTEENQRLRGSQ